MKDIYDYCIIGGGISGLYTAYQLLKNNKSSRKNIKILLLESSSRLGGRINTISFKDKDGIKIQYEAGGARFSNKHSRFVKLLKELDLYKDSVPISSKIHFQVPDNKRKEYQKYITEFSSFDDIISRITSFIKKEKISDNELRNTTLVQLCKNRFNKYYPKDKYKMPFYKFVGEYFSYWSEYEILNSLDALQIFNNEFKSTVQYYTLKNGYGSVITRLNNQCHKLSKINNVSLFKCELNSHVNTIIHNMNDNIFNIYCLNYNNLDNNNLDNNKLDNNQGKINYKSKNIIFAIPLDKLLNIDIKCTDKDMNNIFKYKIKELKNIVNNNLSQQPLYRIYARYPPYYYKLINKTDCNCNDNINDNKKKIKINNVWFKDLDKITTPNPIKYIIPINEKNGVIMISYTDGINSTNLTKLLSNNNINDIDFFNNEIKLAIQYHNIILPKPKWIKHYYWADGATYWTKYYNTKNINYKVKKNIKPIEYSKYLGNLISRYYNIFKNNKIFIIGENISIHQAWVEGALQSVDDYLLKILFNKNTVKNTNLKNTNLKNTNLKNTNLKNDKNKIKLDKRTRKKIKTVLIKGGNNTNTNTNTKKYKKYTLNEVSKHNNKNSAWIVIDKNVYDITNWIPLHPGGDIIMRGVGIGKDANELFNKFHNHSSIALKKLKKFKIGYI